MHYSQNTSRLLVLLVGLATATSPSAAFGQDSKGGDGLQMSSYDDLLTRVRTLESRIDEAQHQHHHQHFMAPAQQHCRSGFYGNYELVLAKPIYSNATAFYIHDTLPGVTESALLEEFQFDAKASHRFELGYLNPSSNLGWRARFWFFDTDAVRVSPDNVDVKVGVADDPDIAIDTISAGSNDFLVATASTKLDVMDFEVQSRRCLCQNLVTLSAGGRYTRIEHDYNGVEIIPGSPTGTQLIADHNFEGAGPTIAINSLRHIGDTNLGWEIGGRGSILFGSSNARWDRYNAPLDLGDSILHNDQTRIVSVGELRLGLQYEREVGASLLALSSGVEGQLWFNGGTPMSAGQDGATDSDHITSPWSHDFGFLNIYFRANIEF